MTMVRLGYATPHYSIISYRENCPDLREFDVHEIPLEQGNYWPFHYFA